MAYEEDPYLLPNGTLKNKLGISDAEELAQVEADLVENRELSLTNKGPTGKFDFRLLKAIHHYLFQDIYEWAGKIRITDLYKADNQGLHQFTANIKIEKEAQQIFFELARNQELKNLHPNQFIDQITKLFNEINILHPFREGNGRTQRAFTKALAQQAGHKLRFKIITRERMIRASIQGMEGNLEMMQRIFKEISDPERVKPLEEAINFLESQGFDWNNRYITTTEEGRNYKGTFVGQNGENFMMHDGKIILVGKIKDLDFVPDSGKPIEFHT